MTIAPKSIRIALSIIAMGLWGVSLWLPMVIWREAPACPGWLLLVPSLAWVWIFPWALMNVGFWFLIGLNFQGRMWRWLTICFIACFFGVTIIHLQIFDPMAPGLQMGLGTVIWSASMFLMAMASLIRENGGQLNR